MGYVYTIIATFMFSFVGTCGSLAKEWVSPEIVAFGRFFFGVIALLIYMLIAKKKIQLRFVGRWIWIGIIFKVINYIAENTALAHGYSFGIVMSWPVQCVTILLFSIFMLHEKITPKEIVGALLCVIGVFVISWNGKSVAELMDNPAAVLYNLLYVVAGVCAAAFTTAQKKLTKDMDSCNLNLSMFIGASVLLGATLPFTGSFTGEFKITALIGLMGLGVITGIAFLLVTEAMKTVPLFLATIIQSMNVLLALVWSVLIFDDPVTVYIVVGTVIFLIGMILVNLKKKEKAKG